MKGKVRAGYVKCPYLYAGTLCEFKKCRLALSRNTPRCRLGRDDAKIYFCLNTTRPIGDSIRSISELGEI